MKHLVFIDDNWDFLDLIRQDFEGEDYHVSTILDLPAQDLMHEVIALKPDCLFIDIYLVSTPIRDLCAALRKNDATKDIPFFLISFTEQSEIEEIASEVRATGALAKPISYEAVQKILADIDKN